MAIVAVHLHPVRFVLLHVRATYYDILKDKTNRKYVKQLRNKYSLPSTFSSIPLQRLFAHKLPVHYAWGLMPPAELSEYDAAPMTPPILIPFRTPSPPPVRLHLYVTHTGLCIGPTARFYDPRLAA
ncbi:hypothetical protein B0H67DRAFT_650050 [Lasiosphaeris hirsuta]|uniref:Uncharacterized protein n=1 Tax=Lasiosphaeris hirsuta TaxID=260670 RepID=A0AA40DJZ5_9PEZI|nr:hypothetical protein B0H67DRAFT_650050 [Lasiosphaeris hirsuta]